MSIWLVLRALGKRVGVSRIIRACEYTEQNGCYTVALALALHEFGFRVTFHTDPDPDVEPREAQRYARARQLGIPIAPGVNLGELRRLVRRQPVITYLAGSSGFGHFSPLVGFQRGRAVLPYTDEGSLPIEEFERRWSGPGYPRQCVLVGTEPSAGLGRPEPT